MSYRQKLLAPVGAAILLSAGLVAAGLVAAAPGVAHADTPESVALALSHKGNDAFPNQINIGVGGGTLTNVTFDTGSAGLYILESAVGSDVTLTSTTFKQGYADGTEFTGHVGETTVTFQTTTGEITTSTMRVGIIENFTCSGGGSGCIEGRSGIMGARYYQYDLSDNPTPVPTGIFNPLAYLPDNLASGYMVAATGPTPSIIVGLTANSVQGSPSVAMMEMNVNTPIPQFAPHAWELKSINACYTVQGGTEHCAVTSFDTGESSAKLTADIGVGIGDVATGELVTIRIPDVGITRTFVAGSENWVDRFDVIAALEGEPPGFNSGGQFYNYYSIAYDYFTGLAYFSPITTWITGSYAPEDDSDLGPAGAIALAGTLVLPDGFSSTRAIFIGNESTITTSGTAALGGTLSGGSQLTLNGPGELTLAGTNINTGLMKVTGGTLFVDGSTPAPVELNNGRLGGNGSIGALAALSGGVVAPGHSIGELTVAGNVSFAAGSTYEAELGASGRSDHIAAGGTATITGGTLLVVPDATYVPGFDRYTVLTADGGITGAFDVQAPDFGTAGAALPFLSVTATTSANSVVVDVGRSDVSFAIAANTRNQRAAAFGADQLQQSSELLEALVGLNMVTAPAALDAISGEIYASAQTVLIEHATYTRSLLLGRLNETSDLSEPVTAWGQAYGGFGQNEATRNTASVDRDEGGFLAGADARVAEGWRAGLAAGGAQSNFDLDARRSSGTADNFTLAAYAGKQFQSGGPGQAALYFGSAYAWQRIDTDRRVLLPGFSDSVEANYDAGTVQLFAESAYEMKLKQSEFGDARIEPFVGIAYTDISTDNFRERGGAAALRGSGENFSSTSSTLGIRGASTFMLASGREIEIHGTAGWQHAFGDLAPGAGLAFAGQAQPFTVFGAPLAQNSLLVEAGIKAKLGENAHLGVAYVGQIAGDVRDNAVRGQLSMRF